MRRIKLGLPKGSLNTPGRGNTESLFLDAGYEIKGYTPTHEADRGLRIANDSEIELYLTRPQSAPSELSRGLLDIAIIGADWVEEETLGRDSDLTFIADLDYGRARLVAATPKEHAADDLTAFFRAEAGRESPIICYTEYINLTRSQFLKNPGYQERFGQKAPLVLVRGITEGDNAQVQVINSDGVTEGYIAKGADLVVDNTQTGSTLQAYGLKEIDQLMVSTAGLYGGPSLERDPWKAEKARDIADQLLGVVTARKYNDVKFNVPKRRFDELMAYLKAHHLYAQHPTVTEAGEWYAVNIVVPKETWPRISRELKRDYEASAIVRSDLKQLIP
ncbi:MAG: ATP phosphoribosyltransferase [Candidatus Tectimicrobiota bacterium]